MLVKDTTEQYYDSIAVRFGGGRREFPALKDGDGNIVPFVFDVPATVAQKLVKDSFAYCDEKGVVEETEEAEAPAEDVDVDTSGALTLQEKVKAILQKNPSRDTLRTAFSTLDKDVANAILEGSRSAKTTYLNALPALPDVPGGDDVIKALLG